MLRWFLHLKIFSSATLRLKFIYCVAIVIKVPSVMLNLFEFNFYGVESISESDNFIDAKSTRIQSRFI